MENKWKLGDARDTHKKWSPILSDWLLKASMAQTRAGLGRVGSLAFCGMHFSV